MSTIDELKTYVDHQVDHGRHGSTSECVRQLIRRDQDRQDLRTLLLDGTTSPVGLVADDTYFESLRTRIRSGT